MLLVGGSSDRPVMSPAQRHLSGVCPALTTQWEEREAWMDGWMEGDREKERGGRQEEERLGDGKTHWPFSFIPQMRCTFVFNQYQIHNLQNKAEQN